MKKPTTSDMALELKIAVWSKRASDAIVLW